VRALQALGVSPAVHHLNEGHCAFVVLQLAADAMADGASFEEAMAHTRSRCVFTTHTPVPAGHDRFEQSLVAATLGPWAESVGLSTERVMQLGRVHEGDVDETLCMTVVAMKGSRGTNGVSKLHGEVSREMWHGLYPDRPVEAVPIGHVTNGVHPLFWMHPAARALFDDHLPGWRDRVWDPAIWAGVDAIPDEALQSLRDQLRGELCQLVRERTGAAFADDRLTIGFARRFAPYKRGWLIFSDPERLEALLGRGVQLVFAGKAHPRDEAGKQIVSQVVRFAERSGFRDRVVLLEDYDMHLGRVLTAGADVWLNNPRRPKEASGTSGQKVCLNGGLNLSILDGWWPEGFDGTNGWSIGDGSVATDQQAQDRVDAQELYGLLEQQVLPTWNDRAAWLGMVRRCIATCAPAFSSHRMVRDYVLERYLDESTR
jgi:alpha-glucan phosphorylase-like protein